MAFAFDRPSRRTDRFGNVGSNQGQFRQSQPADTRQRHYVAGHRPLGLLAFPAIFELARVKIIENRGSDISGHGVSWWITCRCRTWETGSMEITGVNRYDATTTRRMIENGAFKVADYLKACLDRIAEREGDVGAFTYIAAEYALAQAAVADAQPPSGPLHGIPVAIKDIIDTHDMPTEHGSPIYSGSIPASDAACVAMLRRAGAIILGKTVTPEFAAVTPGRTANPHNLKHTPGGSSSGSAAAVADFMVPVAIGTQTVGSTIRPASYCGVVGYMPSHQILPVQGVKVQAGSLDNLGILTRSVGDVALAANAIFGSLKTPNGVICLAGVLRRTDASGQSRSSADDSIGGK